MKDNIDVAGLPTTCRLPGVCLYAEPLRGCRGAFGSGGCDPHRQDEHGSVRDRTCRYALALRHSVERVQRCARLGWVELGLGGRGGGRAGFIFARHRHGRLGQGAGRVQQYRRPEADKGTHSTRGVVPACRTQDVVSIFAATVGDAHAVLGVAGVFDAEDPYARRPYASHGAGSAAARLSLRRPERRAGFPRRCGGSGAVRRRGGAAQFSGRRGLSRSTSSRSARLSRLLYEGPWVAERAGGHRRIRPCSPRGDERGGARASSAGRTRSTPSRRSKRSIAWLR